MNRRLITIGVVLRKDLQTMWPLAASVAALALVRAWYGDLGAFNRFLAPFVLSNLSFGLSALLIFLLGLRDPPVSLRHDWLTRPIRPLDMVAAKLVFVLGCIGLPMLVGAMIDHAVTGGASFGEMLLYGAGLLIYLGVLVPVVALASAMGSKPGGDHKWGMVPYLALFALVLFVQNKHLGSAAIVGSGAGWFRVWLLILLCAVVCFAVLWSTYGRRSFTLAWLAMMGGYAVAVLAQAFLPPATAQAQEPASAAVSALSIQGASACLTGVPPGQGVPGRTNHWDRAEWSDAGKDPRILLVSGRIEGLPQGWTVAADRLDATASGAGRTIVARGGAVRRGLRPAAAPDLADKTMQGDWLLSKDEAIAAANADAAVRLKATLAVLKPVKTARIPADGHRYRVEGVGYCGAIPATSRRGPQVTCLNVWPHPAQITARLASEPASCTVNCGAGGMVYAPPWAQLPRTRGYAMPIGRWAPKEDVLVTTYEVAGRVKRDLSIAGPVGACPAAAADPAAT